MSCINNTSYVTLRIIYCPCVRRLAKLRNKKRTLYWKQVQTYIKTIKTEDKSRRRDLMPKIFLYVTMSRFSV